jgi:hypothetical protein
VLNVGQSGHAGNDHFQKPEIEFQVLNLLRNVNDKSANSFVNESFERDSNWGISGEFLALEILRKAL